MKKSTIIICTVCITLLIGLSGVLIFLNSEQRIDVTCVKHQGFAQDISLGKINVTDYSENPRAGISFIPKEEDAVKELAEESEFYLLEGKACVEGANAEGWLFYKNNNIYFLYKLRGRDSYRFVNLYGEVNIDSRPHYFPCLALASYTSTDFQFAEGYYDLTDSIYANFNYDEAKHIYSCFSEDYVSFDDEKQQISIVAFNHYTKSATSYPCVLLDFSKRDIGIINESGEVRYLK